MATGGNVQDKHWSPLGRHDNIHWQVATTSVFLQGRHLQSGEQDDFHGDL